MLPAALWLLMALVAAALSGVRAQVALLERLPEAGWLAASGGLLAAGLVLAAGITVLFTFGSLRRTGLLLVALPLIVLGAGLPMLNRVPSAALRDPGLAPEWRTLHPTLRAAVWVLRAVDRQLILTSIMRTPGEYEHMELQPDRGNPHYADPQGYYRAVDLRIQGAGSVRGWLRDGALLAMGLDVQRQGGTAGNLRVALPVPRATEPVRSAQHTCTIPSSPPREDLQ